MGYSLESMGSQELDMTKQLSMHAPVTSLSVLDTASNKIDTLYQRTYILVVRT